MSDAAERLAKALRGARPQGGPAAELGGVSPTTRSTRWSREANCRSLRSAAAPSSKRKTSMIS